MPGEQRIVVSGVALLAIGISKTALDKKPVDKPIIGGVVVVLLLSGLALFGPDAANFAGTLAIVALIGALLADGPQLLQALQSVKVRK